MKLPNATSINQIAYVVSSIDEAISWWTQVMGVGPFLVLRDIHFDRSDYLGQEMPVTYSAAIAYSGDLNVELIEPSGPSIFADWLKAGRSGIQHICLFTDDFAATTAEVEARGGKRLQGGQVGGGWIGYYDMVGDQSVILEVAQLAPPTKAMFDAVRDAGARWDGHARYIEADALVAEALTR